MGLGLIDAEQDRCRVDQARGGQTGQERAAPAAEPVFGRGGRCCLHNALLPGNGPGKRRRENGRCTILPGIVPVKRGLAKGQPREADAVLRASGKEEQEDGTCTGMMPLLPGAAPAVKGLAKRSGFI